MELMKKCVAEIAKRLVINLPRFKVKKVDKDGVRFVADIDAKDLK
jgi:20S proteasome subunit beta 4